MTRSLAQSSQANDERPGTGESRRDDAGGTEAARSGGRIRVLVVDDDDDTGSALADSLRDLGHLVSVEGSAERALAILERRDVDAVVTDVRMPGMDGITFCRQMADRHPSVPVVVITAFGEVDAAVAALRAGAFDFVTKPFVVDRIVDALRRALDRGKQSSTVVRRVAPGEDERGAAASTGTPDRARAASSGPHADAPAGEPPFRADEPSSGQQDAEFVPASLDEVERRHIEAVLEAVGWNKARAARELQIDRATLYRKLAQLGIQPRRAPRSH